MSGLNFQGQSSWLYVDAAICGINGLELAVARGEKKMTWNVLGAYLESVLLTRTKQNHKQNAFPDSSELYV